MPSLPPYSDTVRPVELGILGTLFALSAIAFLSRIFSRLHPYPNLGWDDLAITVAMVRYFKLKVSTSANFEKISATANWGLIVETVRHTGGRHIVYISPDDLTTVFRLSFIGNILWLWSVTFIKVSIALMLLRIKQTKTWKWAIWSMMAILAASATASTVAELLQCSPIAANWELALRQTSCWGTGTLHWLAFHGG